MNIWCRFGIHKWGYEHWGIRICERPDCEKVDMYNGIWGQMRLNMEKDGVDVLTIERARKHWKDLEKARREDKNDE